MQGPMKSSFFMATKIEAFKKKLGVWNKRVIDGIFDMFYCFAEVSSENTDCKKREIVDLISKHLKQLENKFEEYFPTAKDPRIGFLWVIDPFLYSANETNSLSLSIAGQDSLIELSADPTLRELFKCQSLDIFWLQLKSEYEELSKKAIFKLLQFPSTYLCEQAFSSMTTIKTKQRNRLQLEGPLRLAVSKITPRISMLVNSMQPQNSH